MILIPKWQVILSSLMWELLPFILLFQVPPPPILKNRIFLLISIKMEGCPTIWAWDQWSSLWDFTKIYQEWKRQLLNEHVYDEVHLDQMQPNANIISSHHCFEVKSQGNYDKLRPKCRLVPHGNQDIEKETIRTDAITDKFCCNLTPSLSCSSLWNKTN